MEPLPLETGTLEIAVGDGTTMRAFRAAPRDPGPRPGVLVLQEAFGVNAHIRSVAERLAREGFVALAPELFHRTAPGFESGYADFEAVRPHFEAVTLDGLAADLRAAHARLAELGVAPGGLCAIGFCLGGRAAFLANALLPLKAAVSFYGAGIAPGLLERASALSGPQLLVWGGKDKSIPPERVAETTAALRAAGKAFVNAEFSEGGHGFFCDARSAYHAPSAAAAWALAVAFLKNPRA